MTHAHPDTVLVIGATGRVGRLVVDELLRADVPVRALTRRPDQAALPADAEVVVGDLTAAVVARLAAHRSGQRRRVVYLSSPHQSPHPFFQQPNPLRGLHAEVERLLAAAPLDIAAVAARALLDGRHAGRDYVLTGPESLSQAAQVRAIGDAIGRPLQFDELSSDEFRRETAGTWPGSVAEMLLTAWQATLGCPAFVTSAVEETVGSPPRTFTQWAADNAAAFAGLGSASDAPAG